MDKDRIEVGPPIQALAHALQNCFNEAVRQGTAYVDERLDHFGGRLEHFNGRLEHFDGRLEHFDGRLEHFDGRLDKQDATLRLIWKQVKGNGKLPIDS